MIRFRTFRNGDPPALTDLWNRGLGGLPAGSVARPLNVHEFDQEVMGKLPFEADGLIVAERDGRIVAFAHAGFGPEAADGHAQQLSYELGTVAMLVTEPELDDEELEQGLLLEAERYLRRRGATVIYAGGQHPLNPFYWGLYGGSEWAGILSSHVGFERVVRRAGYTPAAATTLLEIDLTTGVEVRTPKTPFLRRQTRVELAEDAPLPRGWDELAIGPFRPVTLRLLSKAGGQELARAVTWDMDWFGRVDGRTRVGLIDVEVNPAHRRQGYGRYLLAEIFHLARQQGIDVVAVQTRATNLPALQLYEAVGFVRLETATLFRLPAELVGRSQG